MPYSEMSIENGALVPIPTNTQKSGELEAQGCKLVDDQGFTAYLCPGRVAEKLYEVGNQPAAPPTINGGPMLYHPDATNGGGSVSSVHDNVGGLIDPGSVVVTEETFDASDDPLVDRALGWAQRHPFLTVGAVGGLAALVVALRRKA